MGHVPPIGFRLLALASALSAWALVAVGGVVRVTESGLGCPDWPLCEGGVVPGERRAPVIEYSHRATAAVVTILVVATALWALRRHRSRRDVVVPALAAALLVPFQALLGAIVVWLELPPWIVAVHFVVGMVFLAATVVAAASAWRSVGPGVSPAFALAARLALAAGLAVVVLGAVVVAEHADGACGRQWPACNGAVAAGGGLAVLQVAHRTAAYAVAALALVLALLALRRRGPLLAGVLPAAAAAAQVPIGIALVLTSDGSDAHSALEMLHVAGAGAVWASLVGLATAVGRAPLRGARAGSQARPASAALS